LENNQLTDVNRMEERHLIHRSGHHRAARVAHGSERSRQIHQVHHFPAEHVAERVGIGRESEFGILGNGFANETSR